eukprot:CAMPEP_0179000980 /NCGR_PEP_ID=MMETSP0795-20121207/11038_1 /TAXON_ID=88552 /ORGANISM="Amoebophrya sp., Strain Ameob2" /LENGTH=155 /DNA_ID=CAMNT_0020694167 /DNA_START=63 /DNA_END=527 /DNA_ORIENTATION=-
MICPCLPPGIGIGGLAALTPKPSSPSKSTPPPAPVKPPPPKPTGAAPKSANPDEKAVALEDDPWPPKKSSLGPPPPRRSTPGACSCCGGLPLSPTAVAGKSVAKLPPKSEFIDPSPKRSGGEVLGGDPEAAKPAGPLPKKSACAPESRSVPALPP